MNEEQKLLDAYNAAKIKTARIKSLIARLQIKRAESEAAEQRAEEAYIVFMDECGIVESACGNTRAYILHTERVEVVDIEAVPDAYIRTKISREPDKLLIKKNVKELAGANWLSVNKVRHLQTKLIKGE